MTQMSDIIRDMRGDWLSMREQWQPLRQQWRDQAAVTFEKGLWEPMEIVWSPFFDAMDNFSNTLEQALQDI